MDLPKKYMKIIERNPPFVSKDQMCKICKISKRTALYLFETGLVPCTKNDLCTHRYKISIIDIANYLHERAKNPEKFRMSEKPERTLVIFDPSDDYLEKLRAHYEQLLSDCSDVLRVGEAAQITGYRVTTINRWISRGNIHAFLIKRAHHIPKACLIDYLSSSEYLAAYNKSAKQELIIGGFDKWYREELSQ